MDIISYKMVEWKKEKSREFYALNIGSIVICSPGKISANVDIRNIRFRFTNDYSAQSSIVKGTECLLTRIHYAK